MITLPDHTVNENQHLENLCCSYNVVFSGGSVESGPLRPESLLAPCRLVAVASGIARINHLVQESVLVYELACT